MDKLFEIPKEIRHRVTRDKKRPSLQDILDDINLDEFFKSATRTDRDRISLIQLPPECQTDSSATEDSDDDDDEDDEGSIEIHFENDKDEPRVLRNQFQQETKTQKRPTYPRPQGANISSKWKKKKPNYTRVFGNFESVGKTWKENVPKIHGRSPIQCFEDIMDESIMSDIVKYTIENARKNKKCRDFQFSTECLKKFIGILLLTGYHSLPEEDLYWSGEEDLDVQCVAKCMPRKRFLEIKSLLSISDESQYKKIPPRERDRFYHIRGLVDQLNHKFLTYKLHSINITIGQQLVSYNNSASYTKKGRLIKQPYKQWILCCSETGYCYQIKLYEGAPDEEEESSDGWGVGPSVALSLSSVLPTPTDHIIYLDSYFTNISLMKLLADQGIRSTGSVLHNRIIHCPLPTDEEIENKNKGTYDYCFDTKNEILAVIWKGEYTERLLTNYDTIEPTSELKLWDKNQKKYVQVQQPQLVKKYHKYIKGVEILDAKLQKYRTKIKGPKWYFPILTNLIDIAVVNAHIIYSMGNGDIPLLNFRRILARAYLTLPSEYSDPKKRRPKALTSFALNRVPVNIRTSGNHYLEMAPTNKRNCPVCRQKSKTQCHTCKIGLHRKCFEAWHVR